MTYAVNLADWVAYKEDYGLTIILVPVTGSKEVVYCESKRLDSLGIVLECDDKRAAAIIGIIRKRFKKHELRCYQGSRNRKTWKRL